MATGNFLYWQIFDYRFGYASDCFAVYENVRALSAWLRNQLCLFRLHVRHQLVKYSSASEISSSVHSPGRFCKRMSYYPS